MRRILRRALAAGVLAALLVAAAVVATGAHLAAEVDRIPGAFAGLHDRPESTPGEVDVLLVETYGAGRGASWLPGHRRPVGLLLVHLDADRQGAAVVALPLSARVPVPGHGSARLESVFSLGGPGLLVGTVEGLTRTRVGHLAVLDWRAFEQLTSRLGGLQIHLDHREIGPVSPAAAFSSGYLAGDSVRSFVTEPGVGAVAHLHRDLVVLDELMRGNLHQAMHKRPLQVYGFLEVVASHLAVDDRWSPYGMGRLAGSLWSLRSANIRYVTAPLTCAGSFRGCRVALDRRAGPQFWAAMREDRLDDWLVGHHLRGLANRGRVDL